MIHLHKNSYKSSRVYCLISSSGDGHLPCAARDNIRHCNYFQSLRSSCGRQIEINSCIYFCTNILPQSPLFYNNIIYNHCKLMKVSRSRLGPVHNVIIQHVLAGVAVIGVYFPPLSLMDLPNPLAGDLEVGPEHRHHPLLEIGEPPPPGDHVESFLQMLRGRHSGNQRN